MQGKKTTYCRLLTNKLNSLITLFVRASYHSISLQLMRVQRINQYSIKLPFGLIGCFRSQRCITLPSGHPSMAQLHGIRNIYIMTVFTYVYCKKQRVSLINFTVNIQSEMANNFQSTHPRGVFSLSCTVTCPFHVSLLRCWHCG